MVKVWAEEAKACWVAGEELVAATAARHRAILAMAETVVEVGMEQDGRSPSKQKGQVEGKWLTCDCCMTRGFDCQVSWKKILFFVLLLKTGR